MVLPRNADLSSVKINLNLYGPIFGGLPEHSYPLAPFFIIYYNTIFLLKRLCLIQDLNNVFLLHHNEILKNWFDYKINVENDGSFYFSSRKRGSIEKLRKIQSGRWNLL